MKIFICNVGRRDLLFNNEEIKPARTKGEELFNSGKNLQSFSIPIIQPALDYIFNRVNTIDKGILFVTDQKPQDNNDTLYIGKIIEKILSKKPEFRATKIIKVGNNPSLYDEMFDFYDKQLRYKKEEVEKAFISTTGGTPACNFALLFNAIKFYQNRCEILYISEQKRTAIPLNCVEQLIGEFDNETVKILTENYDYATISTILQNKNKEVAYLLSEYARMRLYFDFNSAYLKSCDLIKITKGEEREFTCRLQQELDNFLNKKVEPLIAELFVNISIKAKRKEWVDFLGRIFRLQEAILRFIVERELKIPTDLTYTEEKLPKGIKDFLKDKYKDIELEKCTTRLLLGILEYMANSDAKYKQIKEYIEGLGKLSNIRNSSIIAHGFEGISEKDIADKGSTSEQIIENFKKTLNILEISIPEPIIFDEINEKIIEKL